MDDELKELADAIYEVYEKNMTTEYCERLKCAYKHLSQFSKPVLLDILKSFNAWTWPEILGDPPVDNWDVLPSYRRPWMPEKTVTKKYFIKPYADVIQVLLCQLF